LDSEWLDNRRPAKIRLFPGQRPRYNRRPASGTAKTDCELAANAQAEIAWGGVAMLRVIRIAFGCLLVVAVLVAPGVFAARRQAQTRNLHVVRPSILYRSGQMTKDGLLRTVQEYHIKTVVNLRDGQKALDQAEEDLCKSEDIHFVRILPSRWGDDGGSVPAEAGVRRFREIISDPQNYPILIHCLAGIHRTGAYCAIYRMEREHWSNEQALHEMRECGYTTLDKELDILEYLEQYRPGWMPKVEAAPAKASTTAVKEKHTSRKKNRRSRSGRRAYANSTTPRNRMR
jgi:tyrosine-protein phosphatase SIW14